MFYPASFCVKKRAAGDALASSANAYVFLVYFLSARVNVLESVYLFAKKLKNY